MSSELLDAAGAWLAQDPDPVTAAQTRELIAAAEAGEPAALAELSDAFGTRLSFGTAGLRGALGAGPNRMNRVLVAQAAAGFARYLRARFDSAALGSTGERPIVVIGYDGRVNSDVFARDSAEIFAGAGLRAVLLPRALPTPVLAFAVRHLGAAAGVMVTASHNPPQDNGYKVYLGGPDGGSQIVAPADADIAAHIAAVAESVTFEQHPRGEVELAAESVVTAYVEATAKLLSAPQVNLNWVYTAMHGVGFETFHAVIGRAGFNGPHVVAAQRDPDGAFPTVAFPNPEEPGAMDLAFELAAAERAELVIAHDPDADRLAVAIPHENGYRRLSGNEVGLLLGWRMAELATRAATIPHGTLACSIVSSPGLKAIADEYGLSFADTPTGFKWISRAPDLLFGFEEALGYLVNPGDVRDKDGISAAAAFLAMAAELKAAGRTVADRLDELVERFGCFASAQISVRVSDLAQIADTMARLRQHPPSELGGIRVEQLDDLAAGFGELPPSDVLRFWLAGGSRVMVRPSGTEPKLKVYIDAAATSGTVAERRAAAEATVATLEAALRAIVA